MDLLATDNAPLVGVVALVLVTSLIFCFAGSKSSKNEEVRKKQSGRGKGKAKLSTTTGGPEPQTSGTNKIRQQKQPQSVKATTQSGKSENSSQSDKKVKSKESGKSKKNRKKHGGKSGGNSEKDRVTEPQHTERQEETFNDNLDVMNHQNQSSDDTSGGGEWNEVTFGKKKGKKNHQRGGGGGGHDGGNVSAKSNNGNSNPATGSNTKADRMASSSSSNHPAQTTSVPNNQVGASGPEASQGSTRSTKRDNHLTLTVKVDPKRLGVIIGAQAATLKKIEESTGCKINIPQREAAGGKAKVAVVVSGPVEGARIAEKTIKSLASKGYSALTSGSDFVEVSMNIHRDYFSDIVGNRGATITAIREQLNVDIVLPNDRTVGGRVLVAGPKDNVQQCQAIINDLLQFHHSKLTHPGVVHAEFEVVDWQMAKFIGPQGANIKHIQGDSRARMYVPRDHSINKNVVVVGFPEQVEVAMRHVKRLLQDIVREAEIPDNQNDDSYAEDEDGPDEPWMAQYMYHRR